MDALRSHQPGNPPASMFCGFASAAALLAAHRAFIAAASCARRSGERLSFLFTFLAALRLFVPAVLTGGWAVTPPFSFGIGVKDLALSRASGARAATFLRAFIAFVFVIASSLRFSL